MDFIIQVVVPLLVGVAASLIATVVILKSKAFIRLEDLSGNLPSWELLFANDQDGNAKKGKIDNLIDAVGKAYPIKVKLFPEGNITIGERFETFNAQLLFVENEEGKKLVTALNVDHISMFRKPDGGREFQDDAYHMYLLPNTRGDYFTARYYLNGEKKYSKMMRRRMTWYGLVPPSRN